MSGDSSDTAAQAAGEGEKRPQSAAPRRINVAVSAAMLTAIEQVIAREQVSVTRSIRRLLAYGDMVYRAIKDQSGYTQAGTMVGDDLAQMLDQLLSQGLVTLAWRSASGLRQVCITRAGRALHTAVFSGELAAITTARTMLSQAPGGAQTDRGR